jgi:hypothetical protein
VNLSTHEKKMFKYISNTFATIITMNLVTLFNELSFIMVKKMCDE